MVGGVFDTIVATGNAGPGLGPGNPIVSALLIGGAVYSLDCEILIINPSAATTGNVTLWNNTVPVQIAYNLIYPGVAGPIYASISISRLTTDTNGIVQLKNNAADAGAQYFCKISANPLRGAFQS